MRIDDVDRRFTELLREAGGDPDNLRPAQAWQAFTQFAAEPIDTLEPGTERDKLLFEAGPTKYGPNDEPAVMVDIERQYTLEDERGEYLGMRHVLCSFAYPLESGVAGERGVQLWGRPGTDASAWTQRVEATPYFALLASEPIFARLVAGDI
jgi:hypothetical protein